MEGNLVWMSLNIFREDAGSASPQQLPLVVLCKGQQEPHDRSGQFSELQNKLQSLAVPPPSSSHLELCKGQWEPHDCLDNSQHYNTSNIYDQY